MIAQKILGNGQKAGQSIIIFRFSFFRVVARLEKRSAKNGVLCWGFGIRVFQKKFSACSIRHWLSKAEVAECQRKSTEFTSWLKIME